MYITYFNKDNPEMPIETVYTDIITEKNKKAINRMISAIDYLYEEAEKILAEGDVSQRYEIKYIPKKNGKKRRIDKPDDELKKYMREVIYVFTNKLDFIFPTSAFAYIKGRSTKQMAELHKNSYAIMKFDIKDFFPNCHFDFIMDSMREIYPFCMLDFEKLEVIVKACMLKYDGKYRLPQGAPTSPILSNIAMIPIDHTMKKYINDDGRYSRYADDIYISFSIRATRDTFIRMARELEKNLSNFNLDLKLNDEKTKFIRIKKSSGFWMTGLMINREHRVTIGHKEKQKLKAIIWSFLADAKNKKYCSRKELDVMLGKLAYYKYIEPEYVNMIIQKYEQKLNMNYRKEIKNNLCH